MSTRAITVVGALGLVAALVAPATAQSKRYPPEPVDKDSEQAAKSNLWNAAITPERHPYQDLVRKAGEKLGQRPIGDLTDVIKILDAAVQLLPREPEAYRLRGEAHFERRSWASCAADFATADRNIQRTDQPNPTMIELRRKLGICQARAGKLSEAEKTLAETVASGNAPSEIWLRLGEVRIAMGKLDEAIAALKSALDGSEPPARALIQFLLAAAYDRARRPADALIAAAEGVKSDSQLGVLQTPIVPPIDPSELDYMLALAHNADGQRPEYSLAYFRRFVTSAPDSPWRKRAEEHLRDLRTAELPGAVTRKGTAAFDAEAARLAVRRVMPQMRACLAKHPTIVVEVQISRSGPRSPPGDRLRRFTTPPDGVSVKRVIGEVADADFTAIDRCVEPIAARIVFPAVKERDTFYNAAFHVVAP